MKKRVLSLLLCIMLVVGMVPTTAFAAAGTWEVNLNVSESGDYKYNDQNTLALGFGVQSDDLKLKTAQSIVLAIDLNVLDFLQYNSSSEPEKFDPTSTTLAKNSDAVAEGEIIKNKPLQSWAISVYYAKSSDGKTGYMQLLASQDYVDFDVSRATNIATAYIGFKPGKSTGDLTSTSIRLANATEVGALNQSSAVMVTDGNTNTQYAIMKDGTADTLTGGFQVKWGSITPSKPAYPGTIDAPTVNTNAGGKVELNAAVLNPADSSAKIQYGYSTSASTAPTTWQDGTTFSGLHVGDTLFFYAKVVETPSYAEKVSDASAAVTVLDKQLTNLEITTEPTTKTYTHGDPFKTDGMKVKATYSDGSINADFTGYTVAYQTSGKGYLCKDNTKVTLKAGGKSVEVTGLTVKAKELTVTGLTAVDREYKPGDTLVNLTGGTLTGVVSGETVSLHSTPTTGRIDNAGVGNGKDVAIDPLSLAGFDSGYYTLTQPTGIKVNITRKNISGATITLGTQKTYNGSEQDVVIDSVKDGSTTLTGSDYTITSGGKATDVGDNTLVIEGKGNYTGEASATWSLVAKDIGDDSVSIILNPTSYDYTGSAINPSYTVKDNSRTLTVNNDYTANISDNTYVGTNTAKLTITGTGNYTGTKAANFTIVAADQNPTFTTPKDLVKGGYKLDLTTLVQGAKGDMIFAIASGTTFATLNGHELTSTVYTGTVKINVSITAKDVGGDSTPEYNAYTGTNAITVNVIDKTSDTATMKVSQSDITYGGSVSPSVTNKPAGTGEVSYTYEGRDGTSYSSTTAPTNVGKYKVTATCESSTTIYTAEANFDIQPKSISGMTVTLDKTSLEYNGSAQTVNVTVKDGGTTLVEGTGYTVTGTTSSTNVGSYTVTVTGKGNYTGSVDRTWKITQGTPTYTVPTGLTATFGQKLADITLTAGWSWMDSTQSVGDASTTPKTFKAKFTPADTTNYKTVENIDVSVTVGKKTAPTLEDIKHNLLYTTTSTQVANVGRAGMPEDAGTLTYAKGAAPMLVPVTGSTTPVVGVMSWNVDSATGTVEYQLTAGSVGEKVRFPVVISSTNYENSTVFVEIKLINKDNVSGKITFPDGKLVYNGNSQKYEKATVSIAASGTAKWTYDYLPITGTTANLNTDNLPLTVGKYTVVATYEDDTQFGTKSATLEITPAKPTGTPTFTKITEKGKTLANANLGMGTLTPTGGTLEWVAGDTTVVEANKAYEWKYTPANPNYAPVTGTIVVYPVSTGIVIYSPCYTIKASAGANGTISPAGWCSVVENGSQTFTFTPDKGYTVAKVLVDGKSVGAVKSYTFKNVTKDHTIEVIFMKSNGNPATGVFVMP